MVATTPTVTANGGVDAVHVKEDGFIAVTIASALGAGASPDEFLTVTVSGISADWGFSAPVGSYDSLLGEWTVTLAAAQNLDTTLTFTPPADSDIDLSGLVATAYF